MPASTAGQVTGQGSRRPRPVLIGYAPLGVYGGLSIANYRKNRICDKTVPERLLVFCGPPALCHRRTGAMPSERLLRSEIWRMLSRGDVNCRNPRTGQFLLSDQSSLQMSSAGQVEQGRRDIGISVMPLRFALSDACCPYATLFIPRPSTPAFAPARVPVPAAFRHKKRAETVKPLLIHSLSPLPLVQATFSGFPVRISL